jgi:ABC-type sugar transport system permease subunit
VLVALKDRTDSIVVGAVAVARRPGGPSRISVLLVATAIITMLSAWWAFRTATPRTLVAYASLAVVFGAIAGVHVRTIAKYSVNGWLVDTRLLVQEAVARSPGGRVTAANLARIAGDATVHAGTETTLEPRRKSTPDGEAAVVAVRLAAWRWLELRYAPAAPRTGHWFLTLMFLSVAGPALMALARWGARSRARPRELHETAAAWAFLAPATLHFAAFSLVPMLFLGYLSLHRWTVGDAVKPFIGLANFALLGDAAVWRSLGITAVFALHVPLTMAVALAAALVLRRKRRSPAARLVMTALLLPTMSSVVAIAVVWQWMYGHSADTGLINRWLMIAGQSPINWLGDGGTALLALMILAAWLQVGWQTWVLLAGLEGIPAEYSDLARVDGARSWQRFRYVTLPLLKPVMLVVLVTALLGAVQMFTLVFVLTEGGPAQATDLIAYRIYQTAWGMGRFGLASALAVILFAVLVGLAAMQFRLLGRRISYG